MDEKREREKEKLAEREKESGPFIWPVVNQATRKKQNEKEVANAAVERPLVMLDV